jgi:hypothetical protein
MEEWVDLAVVAGDLAKRKEQTSKSDETEEQQYDDYFAP